METTTTFDASTVIGVRDNDQKNDHKLPAMGSLDWKTIASTTALKATTGVDCSKVTGNRQLIADGKLNEKYTGDKKIEVLGSHDESIHGDRSITVVKGNLDRKIQAGKVTDQVAQTHEETVGSSYKLQAAKQDFLASTLVNISGGLVKINS